MLDTIFATKKEMSQAWQKDGKRLAITKCKIEDNIILSSKEIKLKNDKNCLLLELAYEHKKLKNIHKPLRTRLEKLNLKDGVKQIKGVRVFYKEDELANLKDAYKAGEIINLDTVLKVGDVVKVQAKTKGRGFAGVIKRHGFHGGPRTHGQSDRQRTTGAISSTTTPGRVLKNKRMPGHMGNETKTVTNLTIVYIDPSKKEIWLNGPIPGYKSSIIRIIKTGQEKKIELDEIASGLKNVQAVEDQHDKTVKKESKAS